MGVYSRAPSPGRIVTKTFYDVNYLQTTTNEGLAGKSVNNNVITVPSGKMWRYLGAPDFWDAYDDPLSVRLGLDPTKAQISDSASYSAKHATNLYLLLVNKSVTLGTTVTGRANNNNTYSFAYWINALNGTTESSVSYTGLACQRATKGTISYQGFPAEVMKAGFYGTANENVRVSILPFMTGTGVSTALTDMGTTNGAGALHYAATPAISPNGRWLAYPDMGGTLRVHEINSDLTVNSTAASTSSHGLGTGASGGGASFSPDGTKIVVWGSTSPYIKIYPFTNSTGVLGTVYSNPGTLPEAAVTGVEWGTGSDFVVYITGASPFIGGYPITTSFGTKFSNPGTIPSYATLYGVVGFQRSFGGNYFAFGEGSGTTLRVYTASSSGFSAHTSVTVGYQVSSVGWNYAGDRLGWANLGGFFMGAYSWNGSTLTSLAVSASTAASTYNQNSHIWWAPDWPEFNSSQMHMVRSQDRSGITDISYQPEQITYTTLVPTAAFAKGAQTSAVAGSGTIWIPSGTKIIPYCTATSALSYPRHVMLFEEQTEA